MVSPVQVPVIDRSGNFLMDLARRVPEFGIGLHLQASRQFDKARDVFRNLAERPELTAPCLHQIGVMTAFSGDESRALGLFEHAIKLEPSEPLYYCAMATLLEKQGNVDQSAQVLVSLAVMLQSKGGHDDAIPIYKKIISMCPSQYSAWVNMGTGYAWLGKPREALPPLLIGTVLYGRIVPELKDLSEKLILHVGNRLPELTALLAMLPDGPPSGVIERAEEVLQTLDKTLTAAGFGDDEHSCLKLALQLAPGNPLARWNHSLACLSQGDFGSGWSDYEWRWVWDQFPEPRRILPAKKWNGEAIKDGRIYVWAEQGFGDIIQFAPLIFKIKEKHPDAQIVLEVNQSLVRLIKSAVGSQVEVVARPESPHQIATKSAVDYHCALLSLPHILSLQVEDLPLYPGWLRPSQTEIERGETLLPAKTAKERVGIVWAGRPEHSDDAQRSLPLSYVSSILDTRPDAQWISLQIGNRASEHLAFGGRILDMSSVIRDFSDTAAILANLDHVITVDTAVGHLAGSMGVPVSLLVAYSTDWRWGLGRNSTPWYPNHTVFRQSAPGDWSGVIRDLAGKNPSKRAGKRPG